MKFKKIEHHRVKITRYAEVDDEDLIKEFGSVAEALEGDWENFVDQYDIYYESKEDWVSDRKGYTEIEWEVVEDEEYEKVLDEATEEVDKMSDDKYDEIIDILHEEDDD